MRLVIVRGDHRVNEIKLANALRADFRPARPEEVAARLGPPGFIGPVGAQMPILLDEAVAARRLRHRGEPSPTPTCAASSRAATSRTSASTSAPSCAGDTVNGAAIRIEPAIEVGNIFKLGTRYSEPLGASYLDESGTRAADLDGLLRLRAGARRGRRGRAVRRRARDLVAPVDRAVRRRARRARQGRERGAGVRRPALRASSQALGLETLYDDRDAGPGEKFADAELLGLPRSA